MSCWDVGEPIQGPQETMARVCSAGGRFQDYTGKLGRRYRPRLGDDSDYHLYGVQFHPESIVTEYGKDMVNNFLMV